MSGAPSVFLKIIQAYMANRTGLGHPPKLLHEEILTDLILHPQIDCQQVL